MGEWTIEGSSGVLRLDGDARLTLRSHGSNDERPLGFSWSNNDVGGGCGYRFRRHAVDVLSNRSRAPTLAADYLENLKIEEAVYQSRRSGRKIGLASIDAS